MATGPKPTGVACSLLSANELCTATSGPSHHREACPSSSAKVNHCVPHRSVETGSFSLSLPEEKEEFILLGRRGTRTLPGSPPMLVGPEQEPSPEGTQEDGTGQRGTAFRQG
ncbi:hypothetical protein AAFF_G00341200 [Aldrovandia affinis]|uniref:Uncharacterized protein n=1 Tax=Aldrovandia affinis TaxID=143900 RepID=A0AAD7SLS0_9TELE|nr:hypothetical protein AAFF_G00341200 [Aldrovandia affinis]